MESDRTPGWGVEAAMALGIGLLTGSASALFLTGLDFVTQLRLEHPALLWGLPLMGIACAWAYRRIDPSAAGGTRALLEQIRTGSPRVSWTLAPLVLFATWLSHLGGASVGREGTAVQMGGGIASAWAQWRAPHRLSQATMLGMAAGFGSVFGTPLSGAIFAIEVGACGKPVLRRLPAALLASFSGDAICRFWGMAHATYPARFEGVEVSFGILWKTGLAAVAFGWVAAAFVWVTAGIQAVQRRWTRSESARITVGSLAVWALVFGLNTRDYLGLGTLSAGPGSVTLFSAFAEVEATPWSWLWKLLFTAICVGSGFKGGEVTPLFFVGATLGHALATLLGAPTEMFAAAGLVAVFCAASHTPWMGAVLGTELFGLSSLPWLLGVTRIAELSCGRAHLYGATPDRRR